MQTKFLVTVRLQEPGMQHFLMRAVTKFCRFQQTQQYMDTSSYVPVFSIWEARTSIFVEAIATNMELLSTRVQCGSFWAPRSPTLIPAIALCGYLKPRVYRNSHLTAQELQSALTAVFGCIGDNTLAKSVTYFALPFQRKIEVDFSHIKNFSP